MRLNLKTILLLPASVVAGLFEAALKQPDTTSTAKPSASTASVNEAFAVPQAQNALFAVQTSPANLAAVPHLGRAYNPNPAFHEPANDLVEREVVTGVAQGVGATANVGPTQVPTVTTYWPQMVVNGVTTWPQIIYTQTFAAVPDQWSGPGVGRIGYGDDGESSAKEKRYMGLGTGLKRDEGNTAAAAGVRRGAVAAAAAAAAVGAVML